ncbi:MAG: NUDIX hydrolase [Lachnospiraceae bacterium]|nr:NUDIX hydrolase [Lachnospiraceae bacterium]
MKEKYERVGRELVGKGTIVDYYHDSIKIPDGTVETWDFIDHKGAAAVLPVLPDGRIVMVNQYRAALDSFCLEIPAGGYQFRGEPEMEAAVRELKEETGYTAGKIEKILDIRTTVAFCNERIAIFLATDLTPGEQNLDPDEYLSVETYTLDELIDMISRFEIVDSKTICAIMYYRDHISQHRI